MKAYGINPRFHLEVGCVGLSVFPSDTYRNNRSKRAKSRDTKIAHRAERRRVRAAVAAEAGAF